MLPKLIVEYLTTLDPEGLDRIVEAQDWITGYMVSPMNPATRCLVGHGKGARRSQRTDDYLCSFTDFEWDVAGAFDTFAMSRTHDLLPPGVKLTVKQLSGQQIAEYRRRGAEQAAREIKAFIAGMRGGIGENEKGTALDLHPEGVGEDARSGGVHEVCSAEPADQALLVEGAAV